MSVTSSAFSGVAAWGQRDRTPAPMRPRSPEAPAIILSLGGCACGGDGRRSAAVALIAPAAAASYCLHGCGGLRGGIRRPLRTLVAFGTGGLGMGTTGAVPQARTGGAAYSGSGSGTRGTPAPGGARGRGAAAGGTLASLGVLAQDALYAAAAARWMPLGACQGEDPELFFPAGPLGSRSQIDAAKQVCMCCPVRGECLAYALASGQPDGIWGGTTQEERRGARVLVRRPDGHLAGDTRASRA